MKLLMVQGVDLKGLHGNNQNWTYLGYITPCKLHILYVNKVYKHIFTQFASWRIFPCLGSMMHISKGNWLNSEREHIQ